jgi:hypothetical protein
MTYSTGSGSRREYTVSENAKKEKNAKIGPKNEPKLTQTGKNRPKSEKVAPQIKHFESRCQFLMLH